MMLVKNFTSQTVIFQIMEDVAKQIGNNIKAARKAKKLTQKEVAQHMYMTK